MALTPEQVVEKRFQATKFREGYDQDEVDDFLDEVVGELRRLNAENEELRDKLSACERQVAELSPQGQRGATPFVGVPAQEDGGDRAQEEDAEPEPPTPAPQPVREPAAAAPAAEAPAAEAPAAEAPAAEAPAAVTGQGPEAATGMLALAQRLHDEHVRSGQQKRDQLISEAEAQAARLVSEAEDRHRETLGSLERERSLLERKIDELRSFERDYRTRLKSYLEGQLRDLETRGAMAPGTNQQDGGG